MRSVGEEEASAVQWALQRFIAHLTRCRFAPHYVSCKELASPATVVLPGQLEAKDVALLDDFVVGAAEERSLAIVAVPELRTSHDITELLLVLAQNPRWLAPHVALVLWGGEVRAKLLPISVPCDPEGRPLVP